MNVEPRRLLLPLGLLIGGIGIGVVQVLVLPLKSMPAATPELIGEVIFAILSVGAMFYLPFLSELTALETEEVARIYPPILLGFGLFFVRSVTDIVDEFFEHPPLMQAVLEDGFMIASVCLFLVGISRWVSDYKRREEELRRQNERLDLFASTISHDLRNPLRSAQSNLELAQAESESELLAEVGRAHARMEELITDLLSLAQQGQAVSDTELVDVAEAARAVWGQIETAEATLVADAITVQADRSRLEQLLENLVSNAVTHGPADVSVCVGPTDDGFYVADDGPGIPADERDYVFEYGYSTTETGSGLGLAIVAEIAQAHGWAVSVTESDSGGCRFEFRT